MEPNRDNPNKNGKPEEEKKPKGNFWLPLIITAAVVLMMLGGYNLIRDMQYTETTWTEFLEAKNTDQLQEVQFKYDRVIYLTKEEAAKPAGEQKAAYTGLPSGGDVMALATELVEMGVKKNY